MAEFADEVMQELRDGAPHVGVARDRALANRIPEEQRCARCDGTGNEFYSMYRRCSDCGGSGIASAVGSVSLALPEEPE